MSSSRGTTYRTLGLPLVVGLLLAGLLLVPSAGEAQAAREILLSMRPHYERLEEYSATLEREELVDGKLSPKETISMKFALPFQVYLRWNAPPFEGREILYREGLDDGRFFIKLAQQESFGLLRYLLRLWGSRVSLESSRAVRGQHHRLSDIGMGRLIDMIEGDLRKADRLHDPVRISEPRERDFEGRRVWYLRAEFAEPPPSTGFTTPRRMSIWEIAEDNGVDAYLIVRSNPAISSLSDTVGRGEPVAIPRYYAQRVELLVDQESRLPVHVEIYWADELYERYSYKDLNLEPRFQASDFEPGSYGF